MAQLCAQLPEQAKAANNFQKNATFLKQNRKADVFSVINLQKAATPIKRGQQKGEEMMGAALAM